MDASKIDPFKASVWLIGIFMRVLYVVGALTFSGATMMAAYAVGPAGFWCWVAMPGMAVFHLAVAYVGYQQLVFTINKIIAGKDAW